MDSARSGSNFFLWGFALSLLFIHCQTRSSDNTEPARRISEDADNPSDMMTKDVLIIISDSASEEAKQLASTLAVRQEITPRVRIVSLDAAQASALMKYPGIYLLEGQQLPPEAQPMLSEAERLFVDGWLARVPESEKERAGEGLKWNDPNFLPPDSIRKN